MYALINVDAQGFAKLTSLTISRPFDKAYICASVANGPYENKVFLDLPINRYYMAEKSAPLAEKIYQRHVQRDNKDAYVMVRIKNGFAVIENLYVGGQRIEDAVKKGGGN